MIRTSVSFTEPQMEYLRAEAERLGISTADVVRRMIDENRNVLYSLGQILNNHTDTQPKKEYPSG